MRVKASTGLIIGILLSVFFTVLIYLLTPFLSHFESSLIPRNTASWYFWKLPVRSDFSMLLVWLLYATHQVFVWWVFYKARRDNEKFSPYLSKINFIAFAGNVFFIVLHFIETQFLYDGLAQDVPIWSSQDSVILFLALMLIIMNPLRGLFLGKRVKFSERFTAWLRTYHPYYFWWAFVYTFWFHPMTGTIAHLFGFFYMFLLLTQGSLLYTRVHLNKYWITFLESFVLVHATVVALYQGTAMWTMFFTGFLGMFALTYVYGLSSSKSFRIGSLIVYVLLVFIVYLSDLSRLLRLEPLWIPLILYGLALVIGFIGGKLMPKRIIS